MRASRVRDPRDFISHARDQLERCARADPRPIEAGCASRRFDLYRRRTCLAEGNYSVAGGKHKFLNTRRGRKNARAQTCKMNRVHGKNRADNSPLMAIYQRARARVSFAARVQRIKKIIPSAGSKSGGVTKSVTNPPARPPAGKKHEYVVHTSPPVVVVVMLMAVEFRGKSDREKERGKEECGGRTREKEREKEGDRKRQKGRKDGR